MGQGVRKNQQKKNQVFCVQPQKQLYQLAQFFHTSKIMVSITTEYFYKIQRLRTFFTHGCCVAAFVSLCNHYPTQQTLFWGRPTEELLPARRNARGEAKEQSLAHSNCVNVFVLTRLLNLRASGKTENMSLSVQATNIHTLRLCVRLLLSPFLIVSVAVWITVQFRSLFELFQSIIKHWS